MKKEYVARGYHYMSSPMMEAKWQQARRFPRPRLHCAWARATPPSPWCVNSFLSHDPPVEPLDETDGRCADLLQTYNVGSRGIIKNRILVAGIEFFGNSDDFNH